MKKNPETKTLQEILEDLKIPDRKLAEILTQRYGIKVSYITLFRIRTKGAATHHRALIDALTKYYEGHSRQHVPSDAVQIVSEILERLNRVPELENRVLILEKALHLKGGIR